MASRFSLPPPQVEARSLPAIGWSYSVVLLREAATVDRSIGPIVQRPALSARPLQRAGCLPLGRLTVRLDDESGLVYQGPLASSGDQA